MDLSSLQAFVKVVQTGSFTRAADALNTQKAYLSRVISRLERELGARLLERTTRALSASREYLARRGSPRNPEDLAKHDVLAFAGGSHHATWTLHHAAKVARVELQPRLKANNVFAVRDAAVTGLGVAQLPLVVAAPAVDAGQLHAVLAAWSPPAVGVHAVFASARYLTPKVRAFIDMGAYAMSGK